MIKEKLLTVEVLDFLEPNLVFATGITVDSEKGINMDNSGKQLRWVAVRGVIHDWTMYCHFAQHSAQFISEYGHKVYDKTAIRKLLPCTDEAFKFYRF